MSNDAANKSADDDAWVQSPATTRSNASLLSWIVRRRPCSGTAGRGQRSRVASSRQRSCFGSAISPATSATATAQRQLAPQQQLATIVFRQQSCQLEGPNFPMHRFRLEPYRKTLRYIIRLDQEVIRRSGGAKTHDALALRLQGECSAETHTFI
jgi:hypothetical protein